MSRQPKPEDNLLVRIYEANTVDSLANLMNEMYNVDQIDPYYWIGIVRQMHPEIWMDAREKMIEKCS
jgi:hypothetical protein